MEDQLEAENKPGYIYIIQEGTSNYYKVGASENEGTLVKRLSNLQSGNWRKLTIKQTNDVSNMNLAEQDAHDKLEPQNVSQGGGTEWFQGPFQTIKAAVKAAAAKYPP